MPAGTIGLLATPVETLDDYFANGGRLPALSVEQSQAGLDDGGPVQWGTAAAYVSVETRDVSVARDRDGDPGGIMVERVATTEPVVADWVADPTGTGLVTASSLAGADANPFPFDLFRTVTGEPVARQAVNVRDLHLEWTRDDALGDVWMVGADRGTEDDPATSIDYHGAAEPDVRPTIGLGFDRAWNGTHVRGVVYASGYVAVYAGVDEPGFARFVAEELLPFCAPADDEAPGEQASLGETAAQEGE